MTSARTPNPGYIPAVFQSLVDIGSTAVIDIGLAGLFDRFERTFGARFTAYLLGLLGLTLVIVCVGLIASFISPVISWFLDDEARTTRAHAITTLFYIVLLVSASVLAISSSIDQRLEIRQARRVLDEARTILGQVQMERVKKVQEVMEQLAEWDPDLKNAMQIVSEHCKTIADDLALDGPSQAASPSPQSPPGTPEKTQP